MASQTINLRQLIVPTKKDWCFVDCDWAQVENRIGAILTGETFLLEAFERGEDIYKKVYSQMFKVPLDSVTKTQRQIGKQLVLGQNYDMSYKGLSKALKCSEDEARVFIDQYRKAHPATQAAKQELLYTARKEGYVRTYYGRVRYLNNINAEEYGVRSAAEREVWNTYIQGTAADILKMSIVRLGHLFRKNDVPARMVLPVHDEILTEASVRECDIWEVRNIMKQAMEVELKGYKLPVEAEFGWNFGELKSYSKFCDITTHDELKEKLLTSSYFSQKPEEKPESVEEDEEEERSGVSSFGSLENIRLIENDYQTPAVVLTIPDGSEISQAFLLKLNEYKDSSGYFLYVCLTPKGHTFKLPYKVKPAVKLLLDTLPGRVDILT